MEKKQEKKKNIEEKNLLESVASRGRKFQGIVIRKFEKRITIEFERVRYVKKYERYEKSKTKIHAYLPEKFKDEIKIGDYIEVQECRPLSKIIHHVVVGKIRDVEQGGKE